MRAMKKKKTRDFSLLQLRNGKQLRIGGHKLDHMGNPTKNQSDGPLESES